MAEGNKTTWHGFAALALESELRRVVMVPDLGGKIVSIFDKAHDHEWLVPPMREVKQVQFGATFVEQDMAGWDEMLPTITACTVDGFSYPDHGEVWSIPWTVEQVAGKLILSVDGVARPYHFTRAATLVTADELELHYRLKNTGDKPMPYLYAAHPQFAATPSTRILLPEDVTQVVNVIEDDPSFGPAGKMHAWPEGAMQNGASMHLNRVRSADLHACRKFYIYPKQHITWAVLAQDDLGCELRMSWSPVDLPYMGLWIDEGTWNNVPVAAPEPSNGYYDSLERAIANHQVMTLQPGEGKSWKIRVNLGEL
jgi:galactose mutarotase-like enzyme